MTQVAQVGNENPIIPMLKLLSERNKMLRQKSSPVEQFDDELKNTIASILVWCEGKQLVGISAPELGIPKRIIVVWEKALKVVLVNPVVVKMKGEHRVREGCFNLPGKQYWVTRPKIVKVRYQTMDGEQKSLKGHNLTAQILMHETDHLDGVLIDQIGKETE